MLSVSYFPGVGALSDVASLSITSASVDSHSLSSGKLGAIFMNTGTQPCWIGGSTVDPSSNRGLQIFPTQCFHFDKAKNNFQAWFTCAAGESTTISVVEYS